MKDKSIEGVLSSPKSKTVYTKLSEEEFINKLMKSIPDYVIYKGLANDDSYN
jgi:hypothetical protein